MLLAELLVTVFKGPLKSIDLEDNHNLTEILQLREFWVQLVADKTLEECLKTRRCMVKWVIK